MLRKLILGYLLFPGRSLSLSLIASLSQAPSHLPDRASARHLWTGAQAGPAEAEYGSHSLGVRTLAGQPQLSLEVHGQAWPTSSILLPA